MDAAQTSGGGANAAASATSTTTRRHVYSSKTVTDFAPPPMHDPTVPAVTSAGGQTTHDIYRMIHEARRQIDLADGEARFRSSLHEYPDIARAMYSVLLEAGKVTAPDGTPIETPPMNPPPHLPVGYKSWLQPKAPPGPAAVGNGQQLPLPPRR